MAREGLRVREVSKVEGNRLLRIVRRSSGTVVTWRRALTVLLSRSRTRLSVATLPGETDTQTTKRFVLFQSAQRLPDAALARPWSR